MGPEAEAQYIKFVYTFLRSSVENLAFNGEEQSRDSIFVHT